MAKFDPFLSLDCARVEGVGAQAKERKGSNFATWQPCAKAAAGSMASTCKPQLVPSSSPAKAAVAMADNNGDMTDSEALRRASQVRVE